MARLTGQIMGKPKGKIGDIVFKSLYGKTLIASAPTSYSAPMDTASVTRRSRFRFAVKLSAAVIRLLSIKVLWNRVSPEGKTGYSRLVSNAYKKVTPGLDVSLVKLIERPDFVVKNPEFTVGASSISLAADALGADSLVNPTIEKNMSLEGVVYLSSPTDVTEAAYQFLPFSSADQVVDVNTALAFNIPFTAADSIAFQGYTVKKVLATVVTKNAAGDPVKASITFFN